MIFFVLITVFLCAYTITEIIYAIREIHYQKKWNSKKADILRADPLISTEKMCKKYVVFCKKNNCKVEF